MNTSIAALADAVVAEFLIYRFCTVNTTWEEAGRVIPDCKKFFIVTWYVSELAEQVHPEEGDLPPRVPLTAQVLLDIVKLLEGNYITIEFVESI